MKKGPILTAVILICISAFWMSVPTGCANIIPPEGGPRDTIPPHLVNALPKDSTVNFKGNRIVLNFDEYVDLQDVQNNLLFSPVFENSPPIAAKGKTLTIKLPDSLSRNTTYIFNFGNAIKDINEGNVLRNFVYTFSTGPYLDSLELKGKVILAENGLVDSTLTVVLHRSLEDSAVKKKKPEYAVKLDSTGNFHFKNLPGDTFAIYVLGEAGMMRRYNSGSQLFAFANHPVVPGKIGVDTLYAYRETPANNPAQSGSTTTIPANDRRLRFTTNSTNNQQELTNDLVLSFPVPLRTFDSSKVRLTTDSTFQPTAYTIALDTSKKELRIKTQWKDSTRYNLVLDKTFAADTTGRQLLKIDTLFVTTKTQSDYGNLLIRLKNIDTSRNPVLQFVQNGQVMLSAPVKSGTYSSALFTPGDYELRILYDTNGNGKWDPGHFFGTKRQPEIVRPIPQGITVKPAWDNEFDRSL